jgi:hypothetical protein
MTIKDTVNEVEVPSDPDTLLPNAVFPSTAIIGNSNETVKYTKLLLTQVIVLKHPTTGRERKKLKNTKKIKTYHIGWGRVQGRSTIFASKIPIFTSQRYSSIWTNNLAHDGHT